MPDSGVLIDETPGRVRPAPKAATPRWRLLGLLGGAVLIGAVGYGVYWFAAAAHHVETDNAYVGADTAEVTPLISGPVAQVLVSETEVVKAGQPLVVLDPADTENAVAQARAALAQARRQVQGYFANDGALAAQVSSRQAAIAQADAQIVGAQGDLDRASTDLKRRQALSASGAVSGDELTGAQNRFSTARSALTSAQAARAAALANRGAAEGAREMNQAMIAGADIDHNPDVLAAQARLDRPRCCPVANGSCGRRSTGWSPRRVCRSASRWRRARWRWRSCRRAWPMWTPTSRKCNWPKVRAGQPVILTSDLYGDGVKFHGWVKGLSGGTGSAFSLIPAQNASGNWIKIVQRLPVRIVLDPKDLAAHPLRIGLSMKADIDVSDKGA